MEPTRPGGVLNDLARLTGKSTSPTASSGYRFDAYRWRRIAVELAIITVAAITVVAYGIAVIWFAGWAL